MYTGKTYQMILLTFFGMLGSLIIGFIFFKTSIFAYSNPDIQFLTAGLIGALFFSLLEYKSARTQIYSMILILILHLIIFSGKHISGIRIVRDTFYLGSLFLTIKIYYMFIKKNPQIKYYLRSFALALFYGILNSISIIGLFLVYSNAGLPPLKIVYLIARNGILIGLGLGIGIDFYLQNKKHILGIFKIRPA
jgi:hypothetical protein